MCRSVTDYKYSTTNNKQNDRIYLQLRYFYGVALFFEQKSNLLEHEPIINKKQQGKLLTAVKVGQDATVVVLPN